MKNHLLRLFLMMFAVFCLSLEMFSQTTDSERFDPEEYFARYGYLTPESPDYYPTFSALTSNVMHILDTLSNDERRIIEQAVEPPAVGIIRDLNQIIHFNLEEIMIPESGEISISGGRLSRIDENILVFTTLIKSTKADELRLFFSEGNFPNGVKVNLFSKDGYAFNQPELYGTLDEYGFYTTTTFADYITLQVLIPFRELEENLYFTISKIIHADMRYMPDEDPMRSCFLDANCYDANSYTHISSIRNATARLFFPSEGKYGLCSGGLLNDARDEDWQPFLLTANHCFDTQTSAAGLEARFNYWSTYCNSGVVNPSNIIINGANLISTNSQTDFTLVLLKQQSSNYYLGWDAGSVANNTTMHSTHHPGGTLMKYHRMQNKTSPNYTCPGFSTSNFYYTKVTHGQSAGGSSGGGVVDPDGRIRGQLYGTCHPDVWDACDYDTYYNMWGRFDVSYSNSNLGYWLYNGGSSVAISTNPGSSYSYGTENVGSYDDHTFTVNNSGSRPNYLNLEAGNAFISGTNANQFSIIGTTFLYLAPGESGTFTVRFSPTSSGKKTATFNIPHNADNYGSPKQINLTGYGNPCSDIISLGGGGSQNTKTFSKSGEGAWTSDLCGFDCNGNEQVYSFVAPQTGTYSITINSTNSTWVDYFWKAGSCSSSSWNCINDVYSPSTQGLMYWTAGTSYYILLDAEGTSAATHSFYVSLNPCSNIVTIPGIGSENSQTYTGGGYGSWYTSEVAACGYYCEGQEQVYSFVAPQTGNYAIKVTAGGSYVDYMWKTGSCSMTDWQCIDDVYSPGLYGEMYWTAGETYHLLLDDEDNTSSNHSFYIELTEALGTWTGLVSTVWKNTGNWSFNTVPTSTIDAIIPGATPNQPFIQSANATCNNLLIESGATLTIGDHSLTANGNVNCNGNIILDQEDAVLTVLGDIHWYDGSYLEVNNYNTFINVYGIWQTDSGSDITPSTGFVDFKGTSNGYIRIFEENSSFYNMRVYKTDGAHLGLSGFCTEDIVVENLIFVAPGAAFNSYTSEDIIIRGSFNYYGTFDFTLNNNTGYLVFEGNVQGFNNYGVGSGIFNYINFSSTTSCTANNDFEVANNIAITQSYFDAGGYTVTLGGNWTNNMGPDGFVEADSRVIFNGSGHQYIYGDETFNILEVNNGAALRLNNVDYDVSCNIYDWTAGGIDIVSGNFTALDLADAGLFGGFWVNPGGVINLTNDGWVDLNGEIHNFGGTLNVSGTVSDWPYNTDGLVEMTNGVIDFKTCGISIRDNAHDFTANITGGTIRTAYTFNNERSDLDLSNLTLEMYGPSDANLYLEGGGAIRNLNVNKVAIDGLPEIPQINRDGTRPENGGRANNVNLLSDIIIDYYENITGGSFTLNGNSATIGMNCTVGDNGTLIMDNPADVLNMTSYLNRLEIQTGGTALLSEGNIISMGWIIPREGCSFTASTANTISFTGNSGGGLSCFEPSARYGNIILNKNPGSTTYIDESASQPVVIDGDFTVNLSNILEIQDNTTIIHGILSDTASSQIIVYNTAKKSGVSSARQTHAQSIPKDSRAGNLEIDTDFILEGLMDVNDGNVLLHGVFGMNFTGSMIINGGSFIADSPNHPDKGWEYIGGYLEMTDGLFEITNNSIQFNNTATTFVSGGVMKTGGAFAAVDPAVFEPTGGTVEITGNTPDLAIYCYGGNYFYNLLINREPGNYCQSYGGNALEIKNDFTILSGALNTGSSDMFVGGNWANYVGLDGFVENNNIVWFYGETYSHILTDETFYDLYIFDYLTDGSPAKGNRFVDETYVEENISVNTNECRILGGNLNLGSNSTLDVESILSISTGAQLIVPVETFAEIFVGGNFEDYNTTQGFFPGHSTFTFDGSINQELISDELITSFYNLHINNGDDQVTIGNGIQVFGDMLILDGTFLDGGSDSFHYFHGDVTIDANGALLPYRIVSFIGGSDAVFTDNSTGSPYFQSDVYIDKDSPNVGLTLESNMLLLGDASLIVNEGFLDLNTNLLRCTGNVTINDGGTLTVNEGAELEVGMDKQLLVQTDGIIEVMGVEGNPATVSAWNAPNYYFFEVLPGGTIRAEHAIFEYMKSFRGINVDADGIVDPMYSFNYCTFRNGDNNTSSALLVINNDQNLTITGASFPDATAEFNVAKEGNTGHLTFVDYTGAFSGEDYEFDPFNLVDWYTPTLEVLPLVQNVNAPAGSTTFEIISNLDWTASESTSWFSISPGSGSNNASLMVDYLQNSSTSSRSGQITFSADGVSDVVVTLNQFGQDENLVVSPANREVSPQAGTTTFSITSNTSWTVSESSTWLDASPENGSGNGSLTVTFDENLAGLARVAYITVAADGGTPFQNVTVTQAAYPVHHINVPEGWSGLSSYLMPANNPIEDVFASVSGDFIIAQTMTDIYFPAGPINTIVNWDSQSAYKIKMENASILPIIGNEESNKIFNLDAGWNLVPVICNSAVDAEGLFAGTDVILVKEVASFGMLWPEFSINTIGDFIPGKAYYALMNSLEAISFPANVKNAVSYEIPQTLFPSHPWNKIHNGPSSHSIAIIAKGISGAMPGDLIGIFDESDRCYGITEITSLQNNAAINAFADDPYTYEKDGFEMNDQINVKLFRPTSTEVYPIEVIWDNQQTHTSYFESEGISVISNFKVSFVGVNEALASSIQIRPNPSNGQVEISGIEKFNHIEIFNSGGELIRTMSNSENILKLNLSDLPSGIYQMKFTGIENSVVKKLIRK